jgi:hypothetical protein
MTSRQGGKAIDPWALSTETILSHTRRDAVIVLPEFSTWRETLCSETNLMTKIPDDQTQRKRACDCELLRLTRKPIKSRRPNNNFDRPNTRGKQEGGHECGTAERKPASAEPRMGTGLGNLSALKLGGSGPPNGDIHGPTRSSVTHALHSDRLIISRGYRTGALVGSEISG